ncbi:hypothetical protein ACA910_021552 [Epithemia clementina (nom. ined.)]
MARFSLQHVFRIAAPRPLRITTRASCFPRRSPTSASSAASTFVRHRPTGVYGCWRFQSDQTTPPQPSQDPVKSEDGGGNPGEAETEENSKEVEGSREKSSDAVELDRTLYTKEVKVRMPDMGDDQDGKILKWYKKEGDIVLRNDVLCDVQTENFTFGMQTEDEHPSIMGPILVPASETETVPDEAVICILLHKDVEKKKEHKDGTD